MAMCVIAAAWFATGWFYARIHYQSHTTFVGIGISSGRAFLNYAPLPDITDDQGWSAHAGILHPRWELVPHTGAWPDGWLIPHTNTIPLWIPLVLVTGCTMWMFRRTPLSSRCAKCHYDRTGLSPETLCPECGAPKPPQPRSGASP